MKAFLALLKLELSGWKAAFSMNAGKNQKQGKKISRAIWMGLLLVFVAVYMVYIEWTVMDFLISVQAGEVLLKLLVGLSMLMTLFLGIFQVMSSLYLSRDMAILSYLPVDEKRIYAARLCGQWVEEVLISALFIIPGTVVYMVRTSFSASLLLRSVAVTVLSPVVPLCVSALFAYLLTHIASFWKHRETVTTALSVVFLIAYIAFSYSMGAIGGRSSDQEAMASAVMSIRPVLDRLTDSIPPVRFAANALASGGISLLWTLLMSIGAFALVLLLCGRGYVKTAAKGLETAVSGKKVKLDEVRYSEQSAMKALVRREIGEMVHTPTYFINGLLISIVMPTLMTVLMMVSIGGSFEGGIGPFIEMILQEGTSRVVIAAFATAMMGLMLGMNSAASTAVSREGRRHGLMMSLPVDANTIVKSKLYMGLIFALIGLPIPCILLGIVIPGFWPYAILCFIWASLLAYFGTCVSLAIDLGKPKLDWINEAQAIKQNMNQLFGLLIYIVVLGLLAAGSVVSLLNGMTTTVYVIALTGILIVFALLSRLWLGKRMPAYALIES